MSSVGQAIGGIVGGIVGFFVGGSTGALYGAQIGIGIGGAIDPPKGPTINGPRLSDLSVQTATYGAPLPRLYATCGVYGNVFWLENNKLKEVVNKKKTGGKGGGGGSRVETYTYFATFAVGLADTRKTGAIAGVRRIWIGSKLFYDAGATTIDAIIASNKAASGFAIYLGSETQQPDPRMQAALGSANCSAHRGLAYIVFYDFPLADHGNSLLAAQVKVEVVTSAQAAGAPQLIYNVLRPGTARIYGASALHADADGQMTIFLNEQNIYVDGYCWSYSRAASGAEAPLSRFTPTNAGTHLDGWSDVPALVTAAYDGVVTVQGKSGETIHQISGTGLLPSTESATYHRRGDDAYLCIEVSSHAETRVQDVSTGVPVTRWTTTAGSTYGRVSDIFLGETKNYAITSAPFLVCLDKSWNVLWAVSLSGQGINIVHSIGGDDGLVREEADGRVILNYIDRFWRITSSGVTYLGVASAMPVGYERHGGDHLIGGVWLSYSAEHNRVSAVRISELAPNTVALSAIVSSEILQADILGASDIDVASLTQAVRGYRVTNTGAIRGALEPLRAAWPFDIIQSGYKLKARPRAQTSVITIPATDLDARPANDAPGVQLTIANEMDTQLPRRVVVRYLDTTREYDINEQAGERLSTESIHVRDVELPIVLNATEALGMSEVLLYLYWLERRDVTFRLPPSYRALEPADIVTITGEWGTYELRLTSVHLLSDGRLECSATYNAAAIYTPTAQGAEGKSTGQSMILDGPSYYALLDIPLLREVDNVPGFGAAMAGYTDGWPGGIIYRSSDGGQTWVDLQAFSSPVTTGFARTALSAGRTDIFDASNTLQVDMLAGELESVSDLTLFSGTNYFALGAHGRWEIIGVKTCTLQADGSYILRDFMRGRFGTEWAMTTHQAGDLLVLLSDADMAFIAVASGEINQSRSFRGVTSGRTIDSDETRSFTYSGVNLKPLSGIYLNGNRHPTSSDWTLTWMRRTRIPSTWGGASGVPLGESSESYEIEIYADGSYATVKRTLTASTPTVTYTSAQQVSDFGANQSTLYLKVYQLSATVGRGYALTTSITR